MGAVALARQTFLDAHWYRTALDNALASPQIAAPDYQGALQTLMEQTASALPVMIDTTNEQHAMRADRFAREFQLPLILRGSGREYRLLEKIASLQRPMVIPVDFPKAPNVASAESASLVPVQDLMHWEWAPRNPALLQQAQVLFSLTSHGLEDPKELRSRVITAIEHGLPADVALDALTRIPAKLLGIDKTHGQIARGFSADLLITDGPLLDRKTKLTETWVQGERFQWDIPPDNSWKGSWVVQWSHPVRGSQKYLLEVEESGKSTISWCTEGPSQEQPPLFVAAPDEGSSPGEAAAVEAQGASKGVSSASRSSPSAQLDQVQRSKERIAGSFESSRLEPYQSGRGQWSLTKLENADQPNRAYGILRWPDGSIASLTAERRELGESSQGVNEKNDKKSTKAAQKEGAPELLSDRVHPWSAFGRRKKAEPVALLLIRNATIWTGGPEGILEGADLLCRDGKIERVGPW
jgi:N-acetylglucosamine-6-phosphate deacetylase